MPIELLTSPGCPNAKAARKVVTDCLTTLGIDVPIIDRVMWEGSGHGVRPVVVYPMNAPANSQCNNLEKFLGKANRKVTFERWFTFQNKWKVHDATTHSDDSIGIQCRHVGHRVTATRWRSFRTGGGVSRSVLLAACR